MDATLAIPLAALLLGAAGFGLTLLSIQQNQQQLRSKASAEWVKELQDRIDFLEKENKRKDEIIAKQRDEIKESQDARTALVTKHEEELAALRTQHEEEMDELRGNIAFMRRELNLPASPSPEKRKKPE